MVQRSPDAGTKDKPEEKTAPKFVGCDDGQQSKIAKAIAEAESMASRAVLALVRDIPLSYEMSAMNANFGALTDDQKSKIIALYKEIAASVGSKLYKCAKAGKKVKEGGKVVDRCAEARCPGTEVTLFPDFGMEQCKAGPTLLHEAAHNAGACSDIDRGKKYPPADAEKNAYSYEFFASDVASGYKTPPELKKRNPGAPR